LRSLCKISSSRLSTAEHCVSCVIPASHMVEAQDAAAPAAAGLPDASIAPEGVQLIAHGRLTKRKQQPVFFVGQVMLIL
jgi:hypothetical protein